MRKLVLLAAILGWEVLSALLPRVLNPEPSQASYAMCKQRKAPHHEPKALTDEEEQPV